MEACSLFENISGGYIFYIMRFFARFIGTLLQNILLSFATSQDVGIVPKSTSPQRIRDNVDCLKLKLTQEELKKLNSIDKDQHYIRTTPWLVV